MDCLSKWVPFMKRKPETNNNSASPQVKRMRFYLETAPTMTNQDSNFMETMKKILACSICFEVAAHTKQCKNGHLLCAQCVVRMQQTVNDFSCPVCRCSLKNGLMRSLIAEQLMMELPAICKFCAESMTAKDLKKHEKHICRERNERCKYSIFGCEWEGKANAVDLHASNCQFREKTVESVEQEVSLFAKRMQDKSKRSIKQWMNVVEKMKESSDGFKCQVLQVIMNRHNTTSSSTSKTKEIVFRSAAINHSKACCRKHGWVIEFTLSTDPLRCEYKLLNESKKKHKVMFFITTLYSEDHRITVIDQLHALQFSRNLRETAKFELDHHDASKHIDSLRTTDLIEADLCIFTEADPEVVPDEEEEEEADATNSTGNFLLALLSPNMTTPEPDAEAEPDAESTASDNTSPVLEDLEEHSDLPEESET